MKKIVVACGSGLATAAAVANQVMDLLDRNGLGDSCEVFTSPVANASSECADADLLVSTVVVSGSVSCEYVSGVPFLTGMGRADAERNILEILTKNH